MGVYHNKNSLSQNFINNSKLIRELLPYTDICRDDLVIEIGPGKGIITRELQKTSKNVIAVEKDQSLYFSLKKEFEEFSNTKIINCDFLDFQLPSTDYKVFANIPFHLTADIVNRFLKSPKMPQSMYFIMQQEAAEKYVGDPETQSSVLAKPWYEIEIIGDIDRTNFSPKPQVDIVLIAFKKRPMSFIKDEEKQDFRDFVIYGYNQWKATVVESFKKVFSYTQLKAVRKSYKLGDLKPSEISFDAWLGLYKTYRNVVSEIGKNQVRGFERKYRQKIKI